MSKHFNRRKNRRIRKTSTSKAATNTSNTGKSHPYGVFSGSVETMWPSMEARKMILTKELSFIDNHNVKWSAHTGAVIDGASIPRLLWAFIGSPFNGHYRRASVIHDVYCQTKSRPHKQVHRMFYDAIRADGVGKIKAKTMYWALKIGAPKWKTTEKDKGFNHG